MTAFILTVEQGGENCSECTRVRIRAADVGIVLHVGAYQRWGARWVVWRHICDGATGHYSRPIMLNSKAGAFRYLARWAVRGLTNDGEYPDWDKYAKERAGMLFAVASQHDAEHILACLESGTLTVSDAIMKVAERV